VQLIKLKDNPLSNFSIRWPPVKFAQTLIARLSGLEKWETNSIRVTRKAVNLFIPDGVNNTMKFKPFVFMPTIFMPIKTEKLILKQTIKWLVKVRQKGTKPIRFKQRRNKKIVKTKGEKRGALTLLIVCKTVERISV
jgi:hypothetical protein